MEEYKNPTLPLEKRVADLLKRMTLEEKVAQTLSVHSVSKDGVDFVDSNGNMNLSVLNDVFAYGAGALQLPYRNESIEKRITYLNTIQKYMLENTRLGIPIMMHEECLHGHLSKGATNFPVPIALASTWNMELIEEVYSVIAHETRARGGHEAHTPVLDLARDSRWGRTSETYGEDTYLASRMGVAAVRGFQGEGESIDNRHIISCVKHFAGYAQSEGGRNFAPSHIPERVFRDQILPPFKAAVQEAGALGVMPSHNEIDGVPCHANKKLLTDILRNEWGFKGIVISDYNDISRLDILFHIVSSQKEAAVQSLKAGMDMDLPSGGCFQHLIQAIQEEAELEKTLDTAVIRILRTKFILGLFENSYADAVYAKQVINCEKHKIIAKKAADESVVLLKNENRALPLDINKLKRIAVIGPTAHPISTGTYSSKPNKGISILEGIKAKVDGKLELIYKKGCGLTKNFDRGETELDIQILQPEIYTPSEEIEMVKEAAEAAKTCDAAVVCVGGSTLTSREAIFLHGHIGDRGNLDLVGSQDTLVKAIVETGTPTIVVLTNGEPLTINYIAENVPAILESWFLGEETGNTIADVLFGDVNPGGKLPITFSRSVGHLPAYYSQKPTGLFKQYLFEDCSPLYPFGFGLSYTTFSYTDLKVTPETISVSENAEASVEVINTGDVKGDAIIQLYIKDKVSSVTRPAIELKGFKRVVLEPGETKTVVFAITPESLSFTDINYNTVVEPGEFEIMVGTSSVDYEKAILRVE